MLLQRDPPINWHEIILDFVRWGWKLTDVARAVNVPQSTLGGWWYDSHPPLYENGRALLKLHAVEEKRQSDKPVRKTGASFALRAHEPLRKETTMAKPKRPKSMRKPGEDTNQGSPGQEQGASDPDAAIAAGRRGGTHRVAKPRDPVAPSRVKGDPERPKTAAVNAKPEISYAEAMAAQAAGTLTRSVLTEKGWVTASPKVIPAGARV